MKPLREAMGWTWLLYIVFFAIIVTFIDKGGRIKRLLYAVW